MAQDKTQGKASDKAQDVADVQGVADVKPTDGVRAEPDTARILTNGVKLVGETLLPGASLLLDGKLVNGAAHAAVGLAARVALGPLGLVLVAADSYSKSVSDKYLWDHARTLLGRDKTAVAAEPAPEAVPAH